MPRHRASTSVRRKLAIISTYDDLCGIAGYTRALVQRLEHDFDVRVFDLDQFFFRSTNRRVRQLADRMVDDICRELAEFDSVNIQLEYGTLGGLQEDMARRFKWLSSAAPELSVTFHTVLTRGEVARRRDIFWYAITGRFRRAMDELHSTRLERNVEASIIRHLRRLQETKPVAAIVHTRRDAKLMKYINGLRNVYDHPLAFIESEEASRVRQATRREDFLALAGLPEKTRLIGVFGFLNDYKGVETAIRALRRLPEEYHLAIFGGVHPNEIRREPINQYVAKLLGEIRADASIFDDAPKGGLQVTVSAGDLPHLFAHPKDVGRRVHFMGAQSDDKFAAAMAVCDAVVLSYNEVGQSASGPMSIAVEMGCRVIATRNHAFLQYARYHPDRIEFFDIGNYLELAERLTTAPQPQAHLIVEFDVESNAAAYRAANGVEDSLIVGDAAAPEDKPVSKRHESMAIRTL